MGDSKGIVGLPARLDGAKNFRDYGGVAAGSNFIKRGILARSDELSCLSSADWELLQLANLGHVVDLRRGDEREGYETKVPEGMDVTIHELEMTASNAAAMLGRAAAIRAQLAPLASMDEAQLEGWVAKQYAGYVGLVHAGKPLWRGLLDVLLKNASAADGPRSVIVHCAAGKDRTGIAVALVQSLLGVSREDVLIEYVRTTDSYLANPPDRAHLAPLLSRHGLDDLPDRVLTALSLARREALESALNDLDQAYGSIHSFAEQELQLTAEELSMLRQVYLE